MRLSIVLLLLVAVVFAERHGFIIAPRNTWGDYGVQSEACRMYNDMIKAGVKKENLIMMSTTDLDGHKSNPYPGKYYTDDDQDGPVDFSQPCMGAIDYESKFHTGAVMLAVMRGDVEALKTLTKKENPRALQSTEKDDIMIYFTSHGGNGIILVGNERVTVKDLHETIFYMHAHKMYKNFLVLMEACHSGSMFDKFPAGFNVYAITASDAAHVSYCSHCPPRDVVFGKAMKTCLSCYWDNAMEWYIEGGTQNTIDALWEHTHKVVSATSQQNVSHFGDIVEMGTMMIEKFLGPIPKGKLRAAGSVTTYTVGLTPKPDVPRRLALWNAIRSTAWEKEESMAKLNQVVAEMAKREVEVIRLGNAIFSEEFVDTILAVSTSEYEQDCVAEMSESLITNCGHELPFPDSTYNVLYRICAPGRRAPNVNFAAICL